MPKKQKTIINIVLLITLIIVTFLIIFEDYNFNETIKLMIKAQTGYVILAIFMMFLYVLFEATNIKFILKSLDKKVTLLSAIKYTFIGFFFSGITPGGGGGQPMEIYYMKKDNIPISSSTLALLLQLASYHIITILLGFIGLITNQNLIGKNIIGIFVVGVLFKSLSLLLMLICLFSKKISKLFVNLVIKILTAFKYSKVDEVSNNMLNAISTYNNGSKFIKEHKTIILKSLLFVFVQVILYYSITYFVYLSFGLHGYNYLQIIAIQALLVVSTSSIPLPGAVGISENVFLVINKNIFGKTYLPSALLMNRGINFYLFMFLALIIIFINIIYLNISKKQE